MRHQAQPVPLMFALLLVALTTACDRVSVGNVGLLINTMGGSRGVQDAPTVSGWVWYNPFTQDVIEFSTVVQTVVWSGGEALNFGSKEGVNVSADVSISFRVDPSKAPRLYGKYRETDLDKFAHGFLRNQVKDSLNEIASKMPVTQIYGEGKSDLLHAAHTFLTKRLGDDGIVIDQLTFNSHLTLPGNVQASINQSIAQTQEAERARYRVAQIEAEAKQAVAKAHGEAEAKQASAEADAFATLKRAESQAKANLLIAEAQADSNKLVRESLTESLINYEKVKRWDGKLPMFGAGQQSIVDLRTLALSK